MKVILFHNNQYRDAHRDFIRSGGNKARAANNAARVRTNLEADLAAGVPVTKHGETRIRHAVKYDLGNGYRLVTVQDSGVCIFLYMGSHDDTQAWLDRNRGLKVVVNKETFETNIINDPDDPGRKDMPSPVVSLDATPYLQRIPDAPWDEIIHNSDVRTLLQECGPDTPEALFWSGINLLRREDQSACKLVETVMRHMRLNEINSAQAAIEVFLDKATSTSHLAPSEVLSDAVLSADANADRILVLNDLSEEEIERLFDPTRFDEFMVWLHPGQKRVVNENFQKPAILTGVSGSGKTCVLVHRARRMAELYPGERILVLTLNQSLAKLIENLVERLCLHGEHLRIDVYGFHDFISHILKALAP